jgi:hypothetical protein
MNLARTARLAGAHRQGCHQAGRGRRAADTGAHRGVHGGIARARVGQRQGQPFEHACLHGVRWFAPKQQEQHFGP